MQSIGPGRVLMRRKGLFAFHLGIDTGHKTVIDATPQYGVAERPIEAFSDGRRVSDGGYPGKLPPEVVVGRARSMIGSPYSLSGANCEHLVNRAHGLRNESQQMQLLALVGLVALTIFLATKLRDA